MNARPIDSQNVREQSDSGTGSWNPPACQYPALSPSCANVDRSLNRRSARETLVILDLSHITALSTVERAARF